MKRSRPARCSRSRSYRPIVAQRARIAGSLAARPAFIGKSVFGRKTVSRQSCVRGVGCVGHGTARLSRVACQDRADGPLISASRRRPGPVRTRLVAPLRHGLHWPGLRRGAIMREDRPRPVAIRAICAVSASRPSNFASGRRILDQLRPRSSGRRDRPKNRRNRARAVPSADRSSAGCPDWPRRPARARRPAARAPHRCRRRGRR